MTLPLRGFNDGASRHDLNHFVIQAAQRQSHSVISQLPAINLCTKSAVVCDLYLRISRAR
jgi:hypothetical protein